MSAATKAIFHNRVRKELAQLEEKLPPYVVVTQRDVAEDSCTCLFVFKVNAREPDNAREPEFKQEVIRFTVTMEHRARYPFERPSVNVEEQGRSLFPDRVLNKHGDVVNLQTLVEWMPSHCVADLVHDITEVVQSGIVPEGPGVPEPPALGASPFADPGAAGAALADSSSALLKKWGASVSSMTSSVSLYDRSSRICFSESLCFG